ncbi:MAG: hypothetical protein ACE5H6_05025 [Dehalococcoidia bacterium]
MAIRLGLKLDYGTYYLSPFKCPIGFIDFVQVVARGDQLVNGEFAIHI